MVGLGEEPSVAEDLLLDGRIYRLLEEQGPLRRVLHQPGQQVWWRLERPAVDGERADEVQAFQWFVECDNIAPFQDRTEEGC